MDISFFEVDDRDGLNKPINGFLIGRIIKQILLNHWCINDEEQRRQKFRYGCTSPVCTNDFQPEAVAASLAIRQKTLSR